MRYILYVLILVLLLWFLSGREVASYVAPVKENIKVYAERRVGEEFGLNEWQHFNTIVVRESGWNELAQNPRSTAFGLCQFLNMTWRSTAYLKTSDPYEQVEACIEYVRERYHTPYKAKIFHDRKNWF